MNINITVSFGLVLGWMEISYGDQMWLSEPVILLFTTCIVLQKNKPEIQKTQKHNLVIFGSRFIFFIFFQVIATCKYALRSNTRCLNIIIDGMEVSL